MRTGEPLSVDTVLVPVDGSDESMVAVEYAAALADRYEAALHVVYVLGSTVVRGMDAGAIAEDDVAEDVRAFLDAVADTATARDVPFSTSTTHGFSLARKRRHPGSVILDTAEEVGADFVVVPREGADDDHVDVLEKTAEYVLSYASQPVLSV